MLRRHVLSRALLASTVLALSLGLGAPRASACGGFFCNGSAPVNQQAERILFAHEADGSVTAIIQIQYAGPAERFAWVLPVAGRPEVGVSSDDVFTRLQQLTNPQYVLTTTIEGTCRDDAFRSSPSAGGSFADAGAADGGSPVTVVDSGSVGPYDFVVIEVDPAAAELADVAIAWLNDNDYDVAPESAALLEPYLAGGMNLLAFRLTKGNDVGSIRPVSVGFGPGLATIPIRPTAVAATEDMGVLVWVLGGERAVPANYMSLELNEALINWLSPGSTYDDVVTAAADEAGGQGFVTEMAGASAPIAPSLWQDFERESWTRITAQDWTGREGVLLSDALGALGGLDGMRDVLAAQVPVPEGLTPEVFLACPSCYIRYDVADIEGFEPAAFIAALQEQVIDPMVEARTLFETIPYLTRFYTTMSPAEMTRDPAFDFNGNLDDVSPIHTATRVIECSPSIGLGDAPWRVALASGDVVRGRGASWPFTPGAEGMPANARILRVGTEGTGEVIEDNGATISAELGEHNARVPGPPAASAGCSAAGASSSSLALVLAALGLALVRRRRAP